METQKDSGKTKRVRLSGESDTPVFQRVCPKCKLPVIGGIDVCPRDGTKIDAALEIEAPVAQRKLSDRYDHIGSLGSGGMSVVYKARDRNLDRIVAIKQLSNAMSGVQMVLRFQREACAYAALKHPNIVNVYDFGFDEENKPFLVMDFVEGKTLEELIAENGSLNIPQTLEVFIQLLDGLSHAHLKGIVHRDLKPANVMIQRLTAVDRLQVKIMDFGIAKVKVDDTEAAWQTQTGQVMGSPLYMSPEQSVSSDVDERADIYSVGCMLFESLTGQPPFRGESLMETITLHRTGIPPRMSDVITSVDMKRSDAWSTTLDAINSKLNVFFPDFAKPVLSHQKAQTDREAKDRFWLDLEAIVLTAIEKSPDDRYQSAADLRADLLCVKENWEKEQQKKSISQRAETKGLTKGKIVIGVCCLVLVVGIPGYLYLSGASQNQKPHVVPAGEVKDQVTQYFVKDAPSKDFWESSSSKNNILIPLDKPLSSLPKAGVRLLSVGLDRGADRNLSCVAEFQNLKRLNIYNQQIDQNVIRKVAKLRRLEHICFSDCNLPESVLKPLTNMNELTKLEFTGGRLDPSNIRFFPQIRGLQWMTFEAVPNVCNYETLEPVGRIPRLIRLGIHQMPVDDESIKALSSLSRLETLFLDMSAVTDVGCKEIAKLKSLTSLNYAMSAGGFGDDGIKEIATLPKLAELDIRGSGVTDKGLEYLVKTKTLRNLNVEGCQGLSDKEVSRFKTRRPDVNVQFGDTVLGIKEILPTDEELGSR